MNASAINRSWRRAAGEAAKAKSGQEGKRRIAPAAFIIFSRRKRMRFRAEKLELAPIFPVAAGRVDWLDRCPVLVRVEARRRVEDHRQGRSHEQNGQGLRSSAARAPPAVPCAQGGGVEVGGEPEGTSACCAGTEASWS